MKNTISPLYSSELSRKILALNAEFRDFLASVVYTKVIRGQKTYSPLDAISSFEQTGLQAIKEVSREEMFNNNDGIKKLLANMLSLCQPGSLSAEDVEHLSGINGREIHVGS
jgi:hypothetical protein